MYSFGKGTPAVTWEKKEKKKNMERHKIFIHDSNSCFILIKWHQDTTFYSRLIVFSKKKHKRKNKRLHMHSQYNK